MAIGITAKLKIKPGKNQTFETVMKQLVEAVLANEEGCLLYALHQSRDDAQTYIILEQYADETALQLHSKTAHYRDFGQQMADCLAAAPIVEVMDSL